MKLPSIKSFSKKEQPATGTFDINVTIRAADQTEAKEMKEAIQSFVSHFSLSEMKSAAHKLKSAANRKMLKTFL